LAPTALVVVDAGSSFTKAYLLDDVDGERRLVSIGRAPSIGDDGQPAGAAAARAAIAQARSAAGAATGSEAGPQDSPVRPHALLSSGAGVPRVLVASPREERLRETMALARRSPARLLEPILFDGNVETLLGALEAQAPDVVVISAAAGDSRSAEGRAGRAALEALRFLALEDAPLLMVMGDEDFLGAAGDLLKETPHVLAAAGDGAALARALERVTAQWTQREWTGGAAAAPGSSLSGICAATEMIAERYDVDVLTLDLGASHAMAVVASGTTGKRQLTSVAREDLGLRRGRPAVLSQAGTEAIGRWLPVDMAEAGLRADARRGVISPASLPESLDELLLEHAFAREALRLLLADLPRALGNGAAGLPAIDLLVGSGGVLAGVPRLVQAALILLDAVQPEALTQLALDRATALPLLGHLAATIGHGAVGAALERDGLLNLGLCIAPIGAGREGETAIRVEVAYASRSPITVEVPFGAIEVVPLPLGERASLKLWPSRDFDVGLGRGNAATPRAEVEGGAVGIIIDARGRPMTLPDSAEKRQAKLLQWLQSTGAYPHLSFVQDDARNVSDAMPRPALDTAPSEEK